MHEDGEEVIMCVEFEFKDKGNLYGRLDNPHCPDQKGGIVFYKNFSGRIMQLLGKTISITISDGEKGKEYKINTKSAERVLFGNKESRDKNIVEKALKHYLQTGKKPSSEDTSLELNLIPAAPVEASDKLKNCHVFISSGPFEGDHTGDTDYASKIVDILKDKKVKASYITGSMSHNGKPLYDPKAIKYEGSGDNRVISDDQTRKEAVKNVIDYMLSFEGPKIFHLQLRTPESGCMFLPEDLQKLRNAGIQVVITCHEWQLNNHRPHYQRQAITYFEKADRVIFLNQADASHAIKFDPNFDQKKLLVSAVPATVTIAIPPKVNDVVKREKNILIFGMLRRLKGFEQAIALAQEIKTSGTTGIKVLIAGKPAELEFFMKLAKPALALTQADEARLKEAWNNDIGADALSKGVRTPKNFTNLKRVIDEIQQEKRADALPVEFHIDLNEEEMQDLVSKSKYAYKPDNKGFANNASAIINLLANGCITFAKWGIVTGEEFLKGGAHEKAVLLTSTKKGLNDFSPSPQEVLAEIVKREKDPDQKLNRQTAFAAIKAAHDPNEGVFSNEVIAKGLIAAYETEPLELSQTTPPAPAKNWGQAQYRSLYNNYTT